MTKILYEAETKFDSSVNQRGYHFDVLISQERNRNFQMPLRPTSEDPLKQLGPVGEKLVRELAQVPGVDQLDISRYALYINLGRAFDWSDTHQKILPILKAAFGQDADKVAVGLK